MLKVVLFFVVAAVTPDVAIVVAAGLWCVQTPWQMPCVKKQTKLKEI